MKMLALMLTILLVGCSTIDYSGTILSKATINNIVVDERTDDSLTVSFNYQIENYQQLDGLYYCKIHFFSESGKVVTLRSITNKYTCQITRDMGTNKVTSKIPQKFGDFIPEYPLKIVLAVHQKIGNKKSKIIGQHLVDTIEKTI